jgi:hypothetical protein
MADRTVGPPPVARARLNEHRESVRMRVRVAIRVSTSKSFACAERFTRRTSEQHGRTKFARHAALLALAERASYLKQHDEAQRPQDERENVRHGGTAVSAVPNDQPAGLLRAPVRA